MDKRNRITKLDMRFLLGCAFIFMALVLLIIKMNVGERTYALEEIPDDVVSRIYESAGGRKNVTDVQIETSKEIGDMLVYLYSYEYKKTGESNNLVIYVKDKDRYRLLNSGQLGFKMNDKSHNKGLRSTMIRGYLIMCGIVNDNEADQFEITSGQMKITDRYEKHKYFIQGYLLGDSDQVTVKAITQP